MNEDRKPDTIEIDSTLIRKISPSCSALSEKITFVSGGSAVVVTECLTTHEEVRRETALPPGLFDMMLSLIGTLSSMDGDFSGGTWIITVKCGKEIINTLRGPVEPGNGLAAFSRTFRGLLGLKSLIALDGEFSQSELASFTINYEDDDSNTEKAIFEARNRDLRLYQKSGEGRESYVQLTLSPWQVFLIKDSVEADLFLRQPTPKDYKGFSRISFTLNFEDGSAITLHSDMMIGVLPQGYLRFLDAIATSVSDTSFMLMFSRAVYLRSSEDYLFVKAVFSDGNPREYTYMIRDARVWDDSTLLVPARDEAEIVRVTEVLAAPLSDPPYPIPRIRVAYGLTGNVSMRTARPFSSDAALRHLINLSSMRAETPFIPDVWTKAISHLMATDLMVYVPTEPGITEANYYLLCGEGLEILPCFLSEEDDRMDVIAGHVIMSFYDFCRTIRDHRDFTGGAIDPFGCPVMMNRLLVEDAFSTVATSSFYHIRGELNTDLYMMIKGKKVVRECEMRLGVPLSEGFTEVGGRLFLVLSESDAANAGRVFSAMKEAVNRGVISVMIFKKDSGSVLSGTLSAFTSYYNEVFIDVFIRD